MTKEFDGIEDTFLTVNQAQDLMFANNVSMSQVWIRLLCGRGKIKSHKVFNSLVIPRYEVQRMIEERKSRAKKEYIPTNKGYLKSTVDDFKNGHSFSFYKHRLMTEKIIGRKLLKDEVIHHINGIRDDNRMENLLVMKKSEHTKLHNIKNNDRKGK